MEFMECLNKDAKKEKAHFLNIRVILIASSSNVLDTKYEIYGFSGDLRDTIT